MVDRTMYMYVLLCSIKCILSVYCYPLVSLACRLPPKFRKYSRGLFACRAVSRRDRNVALIILRGCYDNIA